MYKSTCTPGDRLLTIRLLLAHYRQTHRRQPPLLA